MRDAPFRTKRKKLNVSVSVSFWVKQNLELGKKTDIKSHRFLVIRKTKSFFYFEPWKARSPMSWICRVVVYHGLFVVFNLIFKNLFCSVSISVLKIFRLHETHNLHVYFRKKIGPAFKHLHFVTIFVSLFFTFFNCTMHIYINLVKVKFNGKLILRKIIDPFSLFSYKMKLIFHPCFISDFHNSLLCCRIFG